MSEDNNKSDPIEDLFREKTSEYDIPFNEADWLKLEKRLDKADRARARNRKRVWIAAACIVLFSLIGYGIYQNYQAINELNRQLSEQTQPSESASGNDNLDPDSPTEQPKTPLTPEPEEQNTQLQTQSESSSSPTEQTEQRNTQSGQNQPQATEFAITADMGRALFVREYTCSGCGVTQSLKDFVTPYRFWLATTVESNSVDSDIEEAISPGSQGTLSNRDDVLAAKSNSPFSVGIAAGPDLSTVGSLSNFSNPGYKFGIAVEYRIAKNFAISTGVGQANVHYTAQGQEYKPPYGYWTNGIVADQTVADCAILEIPVNLKYDFLQFERSRIYASAGVSSYIMLNEKYQFNYDQNYGGLVQSWSDKTGTTHWLSNASISLGYELDILRNWSLRAEPFVKLPLKEVGWGNVELYSVGTSISLNLRL
ncbi:outer membrane beta-barrel protein [Aliifodinibius sp. S!AR15-10]|uniref:outer membrane beta-barrel protein n=1 Tax=Aliifodinibius sp. S!AR15-10 TaxID=2950437 RepID=UPI0028550C72|nr:outer membrane beta-barrel protein [Aliifodinibius sp. S!AR15-10]MDR8391021.1 outer membrane beta-barrel protein [Aliifodinibius sp. S!AR15-10]